MTRRLFFGLAIDPDVAHSVLRPVRAAVDAPTDDVRVYSEDDLHLTLCFVGAVDDECVPRIVGAARDEFRGLFAPELRIGGEVGAFPSRDEPRAVWLAACETADTAGRLAALRNRAMQVAMSHGWRPRAAERGRPFQPHVTVARPVNGHPLPTEIWDACVERNWMPVDVVLFESLSGRNDVIGGERYRTVASWPLAVGPG